MSSTHGKYVLNPNYINSTATITIAGGNGNIGIGNQISSSFEVKGDANFEGDIKWKGRSLEEYLSSVESRLCILVPDPKKLSQFEALQKAYQQYKLMEKLCQLPGNNE
jgi:hypothetical protein